MSHGSTEVFLVDGFHTPQDRYGGALAAIRAGELDLAMPVEKA